MRELFYHFCRLCLVVYLRVYHRYRVYHVDRVRALAGGAIVACNHASFLDPIAAGCAFPFALWYLARDSLFTGSAWFGKLIAIVHAIPVSRERLDLATLRRVKSLCGNGARVLIFPEGTRTYDGELQPGLAGVGLFADKVDAQIIPVYIDGTYRAISRHGTWIRPAKIRVNIGTPIDIAQFRSIPSGRERYQKIADHIMLHIAELKKELADITGTPA